jgi:Fe-S-cluster containining protein
VRFFWLNFHVNYACRHSGACCSSGWPIPVEENRVAQIQQISRHAEWLVPTTEAPADVAGRLAFASSGHCVFHGDHGCEVYSARPSSCSHFPYVCLIDQRGVHVTLSHYCPTAAAMLFDHEGPIEIVAGPAPPTGLDIPEGLDAREALPPLASVNRLMSFDEFTEWERNAISTVGAHLSPLVTWPEAPPHLEDTCRRLVAPAWPAFEPVIARYLAAKAFASWAAYQHDDGTTAVLRGVETARAVLQVEAARQCARADRTLDAPLLKEAIRQSDLRLVHDPAGVR